MTHSTHPDIAALSRTELFADGCCTPSIASDFSGLSRTELFALMKCGVLPWLKPHKTRLIPRRALAVYLSSLYESESQRSR